MIARIRSLFRRLFARPAAYVLILPDDVLILDHVSE